MDYITLGALCFTGAFVAWGFFRGFWKSLAAIVSLIVAYAASALLSTPLSKILVEQFKLSGINEQILWGICAISLFIIVSFVSRLSIMAIGKALPIDSIIINRSGGAILSGVYGASIVVFIVWALSFSLETVNGASGVVKQFDVKSDGDTPLVVRWSRSIMAELLKWNAEKGGASKAVSEVTEVFAKNPTKVLAGVKSTLVTPEFKSLIADPALQELVRERDFDRLKNSPQYEAFMGSPSVQQLQSLFSSDGGEGSKEEIVDHMLELWHDIDIVQNDPEVSVLMQDGEIQNFIHGRSSQISLSLLSKGKDLLNLISTKAETALPAMPEVYKWYDANGILHVSAWDEVPLELREAAERVAP